MLLPLWEKVGMREITNKKAPTSVEAFFA